MLAVANTIKAAHENQGTHMVENFNPNIISDNSFHEDFEDQLLEFSDGTSLLESINFDDLFMGDVLPDLEMDPEILAEFSVSAGSTQEESYTINESAQNCKKVDDGFWRKEKIEEEAVNNESDNKVSDSRRVINHNQEEVIESNKREIEGNNQSVKSSVNVAATKESDKGRKSSSTTQSKINSNNQGKRKVKVDWTPELHRRFVQAVEQLGVDKAVPSRILELMGIDCLTRHNIASHLQKYRSHRKHLLAREAEAANLNQRRQTYGCAAAVGDGGRKWHAPHTIGIPQRATPTLHPHLIRPLHVWGHPSMDQSLLHVWAKHLALQPQLPGLTVPPPDPSYWHHHHQRVLSTTPGTPYFPRPLAPTQFQAPPVPGVPPTGIYKINGGIRPRQSDFHSLFDFHPSKESVDAAIGDVLAKPWLPFPLGLRPPSVDGVMVELQRQGVARIPPATFTA